MTRLLSGLTLVLLTTAPPLMAESNALELPDLFGNTGLQLAPTDVKLSPESYERAAHRNQRILNDAINGFLTDKLDSMGNTGNALKYTGIAAYVAVKGAKLHLNDSKTMAIEVNELADSDREISYRINISW